MSTLFSVILAVEIGSMKFVGVLLDEGHATVTPVLM
jgi:hypothetical protein